MCFSVNVNLIKEELERRYGATLIDPDKYRPSYYYHAFGLPEMPAICSGDPAKIRILKWGLIPSWTRNSNDANTIRYKTFNARSETVYTKPSFSGSFKSRRCIIPVKGFFEWQHAGKEKIPYYIHHADNEILSAAGLYDEWVSDSTGETFSTFSIITTAANEMMSVIHNSGRRMPLFLDKYSESRWTDLSIPPDDLISLMKPSAEELLRAYTIGPLVNSKTADRNCPEVIKPYNYNIQNLLF